MCKNQNRAKKNFETPSLFYLCLIITLQQNTDIKYERDNTSDADGIIMLKYAFCHEIGVYLIIPSTDPVATTSLESGSIQSMEEGCPGNRSLMLPHSFQLKMFITPSPSPTTSFSSFCKNKSVYKFKTANKNPQKNDSRSKKETLVRKKFSFSYFVYKEYS